MATDFIIMSQISQRIREAGYTAGVQVINGEITLLADEETKQIIQQNVDLEYHNPVPQLVPLWRLMAVVEATNQEQYHMIEAMVQHSIQLKNLFKFGGDIQRDSPSISMLANQLSLTSSQVDQLFIQAMQINI